MALARQSSGQLRVVWNPTERHLASLADVEVMMTPPGAPPQRKHRDGNFNWMNVTNIIVRYVGWVGSRDPILNPSTRMDRGYPPLSVAGADHR